MKIIILLFTLIFAIFIFGCSEEVERKNPLDINNELTGGTVPGVKARAGDSQVILIWPNLSFQGISEFKIYRSHRSLNQFQNVGSVQARPLTEVSEYQFIDKGLENDGDNMYYYRIAYIDKNGIETPDPVNPKKLSADWFSVGLIPSEAPPAPNVMVLEDTDLQIRLIWEGYSSTAPSDLAGFKIYSAPTEEEPKRLVERDKSVAKIDDATVEFYIDGNDYPNNKISFRKDGEVRFYKVVAFDKVGVESDSPILQGTTPNLPPSPPAQVRARFALGLNTYDVRLEWRRNLEPDVIGYKIYALLPDGKREFKEWKLDPNATVSELFGERYVIVDGASYTKSYYITAYDNTKKDDDTNDESEPSQIMVAR